MRILAIGDVGVTDSMIHIGDEAMFEEFIVQARARGVDQITALSSAPDDTAARYGISAIPRIGFAGTRAEMQQRFDLVMAAATAAIASADPASDKGDGDASEGAGDAEGEGAGADAAAITLPADDPAHAVIAAVRASDGVVVTGGGNMASIWPLHIFERAALGAIAALAGTPLVVTGQTIGPELTDEDAGLVAALLASARRVGLREGASYALCRSLGLAEGLVHQTIDDASFLAIDPAAPEGPVADAAHSPTPHSPTPYCLVTLAAHVGGADRPAVLGALARLFDGIAESTGLEIVFSAHFGSLVSGERRGDDVMHEGVRERMTRGSRISEVRDAATSARLARGAALVVSSRYHPAVFAVAGGVPTIGLFVDEYTRVKLTGALGNLGQDSVLGIDALLAGGGDTLAAGVWADREAIRARGVAEAARRRPVSAAWWDAVIAEFA